MKQNFFAINLNEVNLVWLKKTSSKFNFKNINKNSLFKIWSSHKNLSLFMQVTYRGNLNALKNVKFLKKNVDFRDFLSIVSIENAIHQPNGWHVNNFHKFNKKKIPLKNLTKELYGFNEKE